MKKLLLSIATLVAMTTVSKSQTFWTEDFGQGCSVGMTAETYTGPNGQWTISQTGTNDNAANLWYISAREGGPGIDHCSTDGCATGDTNRTLHVGSSSLSMGDVGAAYDAGGWCGIMYCVTTNVRVESPIIDCSSRSNINIGFKNMIRGDAPNDYADVEYSDDGGITWHVLATPSFAGVTCNGGSGYWGYNYYYLPASCNNNPNVKIGFNWQNNDDGIGTDPSFAVDDITLTSFSCFTPQVISTIYSTYVTGNDTICNGNSVNLTYANPGWYPAGYTFTWQPGNLVGETVSTIPTTNTTYTLTVTNAGGCSETDSIHIWVNNATNPTLTGNGVPPSCFNFEDGGIVLNASGGAAPYMYYDNDGFIANDGNGGYSLLYGYIQNSWHEYICVDSNHCRSNYFDTFVPSAPGFMFNDFQGSNSICFGSNSGQLYVIVDRWDGVNTWPVSGPGYWSGPPGYAFSSSVYIDNLAPGDYTLVINDNGCLDSAMYTIYEYAPIDVTVSQSNNTFTANNTNVLSYQWLDCNASMALLPSETNQSITVPTGSSYALMITDAFATSCVDTSSCFAAFPPIPPTALKTIAEGWQHSLSICADSTVKSWGANWGGQLGTGNNDTSNVPVSVFGLTGVKEVAAGQFHSMALKSDGTVWTWGWNFHNQLGDGTTTDSNLPLQVAGLTGITNIAAGGYHSVALKNDGTVWTWGFGDYGELGNGMNVTSGSPVQVSALTDVVAIAAGDGHTLALKNDGTVWSWGSNPYGELGDGSTNASNVPVQVSNLTGAIAIAAGNYNSIALLNDNSVWSWGSNADGELGDGTNTDSNVPVHTITPPGITAIASGWAQGYALKSDGTMVAWGANANGELGDGNNTPTNMWMDVVSPTGFTMMAGGFQHLLALNTDGTLWSWGLNSNGQLGTGTTTNSNVAVQVIGLCQLPVSMNESNIEADVTIAPNPFTYQTVLTFSKEQTSATVKVVDILGKEMKSITVSGKEVILEKGEMNAGMYFVEITQSGLTTKIIKKIIIQ